MHYDLPTNVFFRYVFEQLSINGIVPMGYPMGLITSIICWDVEARAVRSDKKALYRSVDPGQHVLRNIASRCRCSDEEKTAYHTDVNSDIVVEAEAWNIDGVPKGIEFSKKDKKLMKWRLDKFRSKFLLKTSLPPKWVSLFSVWLETTPKDIRSHLAGCLHQLFPKLEDGFVYTENGILLTLKAVTTKIKLEIPDSLSGIPGFLVDLHQLGGYDTVLNDTSNLAKDWCDAFDDATVKSESKERPHILGDLKRYIDRVVDEWGISSNAILEPYDGEGFLHDRGNWTVSGASTLPSMEVELKTVSRQHGYKKQTVTVSGKEASCMGIAADELWNFCLENEGFGEESKPFEKADEPAKGRVVVNHDIRSYLRCSYLEYFLGRSPDWTALDKGTTSLIALHSTLRDALEHGVGVSLDYSGWDHSVVFDLVRVVLLSIERSIMKALRTSKLSEGMKETIMYDVQSAVKCEFNSLGDISFRFTGGERPRTKGGFLSSGHKWTALANTIINRSMFLYFCDRLKCNNSILTAAHQGDDVAVVFNGKDVNAAKLFVERFSKEANRLGFSINPLKTSVSAQGVEFLRLWITKDGSFGYPSRMLKTLCWLKPETSPSLRKWLAQINEIVNSAKEAEMRGLSNVGWLTKRLVEGFIPRKLTFSERSKLLCWLGTSVPLGGQDCPGMRGSFLKHNRKVRFIPRLRSDTAIKLGDITYTTLAGEVKTSKKSLPNDGQGVLLLRLHELLKDEVSIPNFSQTLVFDELASVSNIQRISNTVRTGHSRVPLSEGVPPIFPVKGDGPGWWITATLGRDYISKEDQDLNETWRFYLGARFKRFCTHYGVRPTLGAIRWGTSAFSPPQPGRPFSQFDLWEERANLATKWHRFYVYGVFEAKGIDRRFIDVGVRQLFSFT